MLCFIPRLQFHNQIDLLAHFHRAVAKHARHVDDADAAQLDKMADIFRCAAHDRSVGYPTQLHRVVRNQAMAALDKFDSRFAFANAAFAQDQDALAVHLDENTVTCNARRYLDTEV